MGSFYVKCGVSDVTIRNYQKVKIGLITKDYRGYSLLSPLINAEYDDYGRFSVDESDPLVKATWMLMSKLHPTLSPGDMKELSYYGSELTKEAEQYLDGELKIMSTSMIMTLLREGSIQYNGNVVYLFAIHNGIYERIMNERSTYKSFWGDNLYDAILDNSITPLMNDEFRTKNSWMVSHFFQDPNDERGYGKDTPRRPWGEHPVPSTTGYLKKMDDKFANMFGRARSEDEVTYGGHYLIKELGRWSQQLETTITISQERIIEETANSTFLASYLSSIDKKPTPLASVGQDDNYLALHKFNKMVNAFIEDALVEMYEDDCLGYKTIEEMGLQDRVEKYEDEDLYDD